MGNSWSDGDGGDSSSLLNNLEEAGDSENLSEASVRKALTQDTSNEDLRNAIFRLANSTHDFPQIMRILVEEYYDRNRFDPLLAFDPLCDEHGVTPLMLAAFNGSAETCKYLVEADQLKLLFAKDSDGDDCIVWAKEGNQSQLEVWLMTRKQRKQQPRLQLSPTYSLTETAIASSSSSPKGENRAHAFTSPEQELRWQKVDEMFAKNGVTGTRDYKILMAVLNSFDLINLKPYFGSIGITKVRDLLRIETRGLNLTKEKAEKYQLLIDLLRQDALPILEIVEKDVEMRFGNNNTVSPSVSRAIDELVASSFVSITIPVVKVKEDDLSFYFLKRVDAIKELMDIQQNTIQGVDELKNQVKQLKKDMLSYFLLVQSFQKGKKN